MNRPDPRTDFMAYLDWIGDKVEELEHEKEEVRLNPTEAARALGYKTSYLVAARYPWRIPEFGAKGTRHALSVWRAWLSTSDRERRSKWDAIPAGERRKMLGEAA